ncbi:MAG: 6-phosphofructokinase [Clostridia bacterium]|nr:6-phosphofructokinase [Clostridia bacterium]
MNIGILASGGDGAGMNACVCEIAKCLKAHNLVLFYEGYRGLIENNVCQIEDLQKYKNDGGIVIKTSRCPEFKTEQGVEKGYETYKKHNLSALVVLGGNGSQKGGQELSKKGANVFFVPCTIDNDVDETDYAIGHDTAVCNVVDYIKNVNATMQSFNRVCIYETMGRHCPDIAIKSAMEIKPTYLFVNEKQNFEQCIDAVKKADKNTAPIIITRENLIDANALAEEVANQTDFETRVAIIGYVQRGGKPTKYEVKMAKGFAKQIATAIKQNRTNKKVVLKNNKFVLQDL